MARRVSDTVVFKHKHITCPSQTPNDLIVKAAHDLIKALRGKVNHEGQQQMEDLKRLGDVFQDIAQDKQGEDSPDAVQEPRATRHVRASSEGEDGESGASDGGGSTSEGGGGVDPTESRREPHQVNC
ncbi:hypothetical protein ACHAWF_016318 [Thalassiosira exigua]